MNKFTRALFQLFLWATIWIILGLGQRDLTRFLIENWIAYIFQALLIVVLIYQLAPHFLFKKKYLLFAFISLGSLIICAIISGSFIGVHNGMEIGPQPHGMELPPPPPGAGASAGFGQKNIPSPVLINLLLLSVSYTLAIFLETFVFAKKNEEAFLLSKSENIENELKFLKSQINPHFLFNSLNNIYALSAIDPQKTQDSILYLSDMLRYVLYECERPLVAIEKEVTYIEDFIKLFELKSSKRYPIKTQFSIENPQLQIVPMLLIPFVENAFKHSNIHNTLESFIEIKIEATADMILFEIENSLNKAPISKDKVGGIGIKNVQKRLSLLYPEKHELLITQDQESYKVVLKINTHA